MIRLFLFLTITIATPCFSQSTVRAYVVILKSDTLRGDIVKAAKARDDKKLSFSEVMLVDDANRSFR